MKSPGFQRFLITVNIQKHLTLILLLNKNLSFLFPLRDFFSKILINVITSLSNLLLLKHLKSRHFRKYYIIKGKLKIKTIKRYESIMNPHFK